MRMGVCVCVDVCVDGCVDVLGMCIMCIYVFNVGLWLVWGGPAPPLQQFSLLKNSAFSAPAPQQFLG